MSQKETDCAFNVAQYIEECKQSQPELCIESVMAAVDAYFFKHAEPKLHADGTVYGEQLQQNMTGN